MSARHGTPSGWAAHQRRGERPCDPCYRAKQEYDRRRKSAPVQVIKSRLSARAQIKAYGELARRYPDEYQRLYQEWKRHFIEEAGL